MKPKLSDSIAALFIILASGLVAGYFPQVLPPVQMLENWLSDFRFGTLSQPMAQDDRIVIATITEETLATMSYRSPVDRGFLAQLLQTLGSYEVRAVGFDILFDQQTEPVKDKELRRTILGFPAPVIVAQADKVDNLTTGQLSFQKQYTRDMNHGLAILPVSSDGVVRQISAGRIDGASSQLRPALAGAIVRALGISPPARNLPLAYRPPPNANH